MKSSPPPLIPRGGGPQRRGGAGKESLGELTGNAGLELAKGLALLAAAIGRMLAFAARDPWRWWYLATLAVVAAGTMLVAPVADRPIVAGAGVGALLLVVFVRYATVNRGLRTFREQVTNVAAAAFGEPAETAPSPKIRRWGRPDGPVIVLHVPATFDSSRRAVFQRLVQDRVAAREVIAWAFAWRLDRNQVTISPTTPLPAQVALDPSRAPRGLALFLGIGHDADGQPTEVMWDPDVADPHALVGGRTKTGKSVTLRALISQALAGGWQVILADPKGVDYRWARGLAGVTHCGGDESPAAIAAAHAEMERRQAWLEKHAPTTATDLLTVEGQPFVPCLVIADEVAELASIGDKDQRAATVGHLGSLARRSRFVGMICAFATQRPDVAILPGEIRSNLGTRVLTGDGDQHMRTMVLEGTDLPPLSAQTRGRGRVKIGGSRPREVQFAFVEPTAVVAAAEARAAPAAPASASASSAQIPDFTGTLHEPGPATPPDSGSPTSPPPPPPPPPRDDDDDDDDDNNKPPPRLRIVP
ncbi:MAG: DUF853 family protein [Chloroflexi bacterium]|nr:DUF853 family protein [Chloroflexota bacterium]